MNSPNLFIVGQPKSGTTALYFLLKQHPNVFFPDEKEPNYFAKDFEKEVNEFYKLDLKYKQKPIETKFKSINEYLKIFSLCKKEKIIGEASTTYLYSKIAAKEIKKFNHNSKIIIILRDPVEFVISLFQEHSHNIEMAESFEEAMLLEKIRKKGKYFKCSAPKSLLYYSERVRYAKQIKRYLNNFPNENILVILFEDFKKDNLRTFKKVCKFIGIDYSFEPKIKIINPSKINRFDFLRNFIDLELILKFRKLFKKIVPKFILEHLNKIYFDVIYKKKK